MCLNTALLIITIIIYRFLMKRESIEVSLSESLVISEMEAWNAHQTIYTSTRWVLFGKTNASYYLRVSLNFLFVHNYLI